MIHLPAQMDDQRDYNHSSASPTSNSLQNLGSNPLETLSEEHLYKQVKFSVL
jgi:hypothetical protein